MDTVEFEDDDAAPKSWSDAGDTAVVQHGSLDLGDDSVQLSSADAPAVQMPRAFGNARLDALLMHAQAEAAESTAEEVPLTDAEVRARQQSQLAALEKGQEKATELREAAPHIPAVVQQGNEDAADWLAELRGQ